MAMALAKPAGDMRRSRSRTQDVDKKVAARLRQRRIMLGMTQQQLAEVVGVTYQQAHKYETGMNRLSAGRLHQAAQALGVGVEYFFQDAGEPAVNKQTDRQRAMLDLARSFVRMPNRRHKAAICELARALATAPLPPAVELLDQEGSAIAGG